MGDSVVFVPLENGATERVASGQVVVDPEDPAEAAGDVVYGSAFIRTGRKVVRKEVRAYYNQADVNAAAGGFAAASGLELVRARVSPGAGFRWLDEARAVGLMTDPDGVLAARVAVAPDTFGSLLRAIDGMTARGLVDPSLRPGSYCLYGRQWQLFYPERARPPGAAELEIGPFAPWVCAVRPDTAQIYAASMGPDVWALLTLYAHLSVVAGCLGGPALPAGPGLDISDMVDRQMYLRGPDKDLYVAMWTAFNRGWAIHNTALVETFCERRDGC